MAGGSGAWDAFCETKPVGGGVRRQESGVRMAGGSEAASRRGAGVGGQGSAARSFFDLARVARALWKARLWVVS